MVREGIYEQVINQQLKIALNELGESEYVIEVDTLDVEEARKILSTYISNITRKALTYVREQGRDDQEALLRQIKTCNKIIATLSEELNDEEFSNLQLDEEGEVLQSIYSKLNSVRSIRKVKAIRPITSISESTLFTGSKHEPNMLNELQKEILSSDKIDFLVSFIKWSGIRILMNELKSFTDQGGKLRIITTSYMQATDYKAILELSKLKNTEIKISYDDSSTRLHAKAYMFRRSTGFTTAYIGSSNLSNPALTSGLEWNVKVTEKDSFDIIQTFEGAFESYWNDQEFRLFDPNVEHDRTQLKNALKKKVVKEEQEVYYTLDIRPYQYQKEMLEQLQVEREVFGKRKNLLVAATGVGKTVISAFDYKRFSKQNSSAKLLFVAHREEILKQSLDTFRAILKDFNFGDLLVGGRVPDTLDHLFVSIQSFNSTQLTKKLSPNYYDFIIVDEFHHAAAKSYQELLSYFTPQILLGLTATPERMDGQDVTKYFDGRIATEMRLPEAIDRKLLSPFQYFCVSDTVDLSLMNWSKRGYDLKELENVYTNNKIRSNLIIKSLYRYVTDIDDVKGLGFCVGVEHAKYMAKIFSEKGVPSIALHGGSDKDVRNKAQEQLAQGEIKFIFVVDLYNEGVDIPEVNTILFLRPTESLTVFLQQLGRGLRLHEDKECLTVLDFVGRAHEEYDFFEKKFRALVGRTRRSIKHYVEEGFSNLPRGSFILLERQAKDYVLRSLKSTINTKRNLIKKLKDFELNTTLDLNLKNFLNYYHMTIYDFYGRSANRTFQRLLVEANLAEDFTCEHEKLITRRIHKLFHLNSHKLLKFLIDFVESYGQMEIKTQEEKLMRNMFYYSFFQHLPSKEGFHSISDALMTILSHERMQKEILDVLKFKYHTINTIEIEHEFDFVTPLTVHSTYTVDQIMAAFDYYNDDQSPAFREGAKHFKDKGLDVFFTTINKSEKDYSPSTMYESYALNERLFHWQSQSTTTQSSPTGQRYIQHKERGQKIALFVREYKKEHGYTSPYTFLGECEYVRHEGEKPISFIWRLKEKMPPSWLEKANKSVVL